MTFRILSFGYFGFADDHSLALSWREPNRRAKVDLARAATSRLRREQHAAADHCATYKELSSCRFHISSPYAVASERIAARMRG